MRRRRRFRSLGSRLTLAVFALQLALIATLELTPNPPAGSGLTVWQLLWASARKPSFYPLVALLLAGPPLTLLAWRLRGPHKPWLAFCWLAFAFFATAWYGTQLAVMFRVLWWRYGS